MLKLPSLQNLLNGALFTLKRFPLVLLCSLIGAVVSIYLIGIDYTDEAAKVTSYHLLLVASLGLTLFLSIALYTETNQKTLTFKIAANAFGVIALSIYYFFLPERFEQIEMYRFLLFNIGLHLLVSFSPFINQGNINGFWQFNKTFFLRILLSALYTGVLYVGLALAMLAVDQLFNVKIDGKNYFRLWVILVSIFNTWFFLAGVPKDLHQLNEETSYPKGLKIFTQFVLLPLVTIYLTILYAYLIKIAVTMQLPKGWVSYLVISFSIAGILSLLLIYPIRESEGNNWIKVFSRWFYRALYPLILLLLIAIYKRVSDYGITENRYYILVLAVWLACIAAYFLLSSVKNIKVIPVSLCLIAFLSSVGPLSSFSVSKRSQMNRLEELLSRNKILVDGTITKKHAKIPYKDNARISSILQYIDRTHELYVLQPWFKEPMDTILNPKHEEYAYKLGAVHTAMGIEFVNERYGEDGTGENESFYFYRNETVFKGYKVIKGYDYLINLSLYNYTYSTAQSIALAANDSISISLDTLNNSIVLKRNHKNLADLSLKTILKNGEETPVNNNYGSIQVDADKMIIESENDMLHVKLELSSINGNRRKKGKVITSVYGDLYLSLKDSLK